jgi:hypothetical protein
MELMLDEVELSAGAWRARGAEGIRPQRSAAPERPGRQELLEAEEFIESFEKSASYRAARKHGAEGLPMIKEMVEPRGSIANRKYLK